MKKKFKKTLKGFGLLVLCLCLLNILSLSPNKHIKTEQEIIGETLDKAFHDYMHYNDIDYKLIDIDAYRNKETNIATMHVYFKVKNIFGVYVNDVLTIEYNVNTDTITYK